MSVTPFSINDGNAATGGESSVFLDEAGEDAQAGSAASAAGEAPAAADAPAAAAAPPSGPPSPDSGAQEAEPEATPTPFDCRRRSGSASGASSGASGGSQRPASRGRRADGTFPAAAPPPTAEGGGDDVARIITAVMTSFASSNSETERLQREASRATAAAMDALTAFLQRPPA